jgi:hypothetical protein
MPDADWVHYKALRGAPLPERVEYAGSSYALESTLKFDFYAGTGLYRREGGGPGPERVLYKVYHEQPLGFVPLGWLGRWLCRREARMLERVRGIEGIPELYERQGRSAFVREYVEGCNLREYVQGRRPDSRFFPELRGILAAVHRRGISHNDLSKPENVLVTPTGRPVLIDFQIATEFRGAGVPVLGWPARRLMRYMQRNDVYHVTKQHRRRRPEDFDAGALAAAKKKGWLLHLHGHLLRRPYRAVRHRVLARLRVGPGESGREG